MRGMNRGAALVAAFIACGTAGLALAQKPPALGEPAAPQGGKPFGQPAPPPAPVRPAPLPPQAGPAPAPGVDKFGLAQPQAPAAPTPPQTDKFGAAPPGQAAPAPTPPGQAAPAPTPPGQVAPAPTPPRQAAPATPAPPPLAAPATPPPADEPETVRQFRRLLGPDVQLSYAASELVDPARGAVRLREVVLQRPDRRAAIAELTLDGLRENGVTEAILRGVLMEEGAERIRVERVRIAGLTVNRPPAGQPMQPDALALDSLRIDGLAVQGTTPVSIAAITVEDYGRGRPGRLAMEGLEVRTPGQDPIDRVSLGRLTLRGVDLAATLAAVIAKEPPPRTTGAAALEAEDLVLGKGSQRVGGMASMTLAGEAPPAGVTGPETGRIALRGLSMQPFPGAAEWMRRFGYTELVGDLTMDVRIDRAGRSMEIGSFSLAARDIGALGFSLTLDNLDTGTTDPMALTAARLVAARLRYVDQSLYGRFVRMQAQESRRSEQQVREELAEQARALFERPPAGGGGGRPAPGGPASKGGAVPGGGGGSASAEIGEAVQRFLRGQAREIEISARPPQPVPLQQLQGAAPGGPDALQQALGLTVTTR